MLEILTFLNLIIFKKIINYLEFPHFSILKQIDIDYIPEVKEVCKVKDEFLLKGSEIEYINLGKNILYLFYNCSQLKY